MLTPLKKLIPFVVFLFLLSGCNGEVLRTDDNTSNTATGNSSEVSMIAINDIRCTDRTCDIDPAIEQLQSVFPGLQVEKFDYSDEKGKKLYDELGLQVLPAFLFSSNVSEQTNFNNIERFVESKGEYLNLHIGADFDPTKEVCDNGIDDTGNGNVDCADTDCQGNIVCRDSVAKKLDLFVMSQCPYGTQALDAMAEILPNFTDNISFDFHFIASKNADGTFKSLHGQPEVDENIREICAKKYYPDNYQYMDYVYCRNKNIQSSEWELCASDNGMDVNTIKTCSEGEEGKSLLSEDIKMAQSLGIGASPTWLANNKKIFHGRDPQTVKNNYCDANPKLDGCEANLSAVNANKDDAACE